MRRLGLHLVVVAVRIGLALREPVADVEGAVDARGHPLGGVRLDQPPHEQAAVLEDARPQQARGQLVGRQLRYARLLARLWELATRLRVAEAATRVRHQAHAGELPEAPNLALELECALPTVGFGEQLDRRIEIALIGELAAPPSSSGRISATATPSLLPLLPNTIFAPSSVSWLTQGYQSCDPNPRAAARAQLPKGSRNITGERVSSPEGGFNPTWQRHVAAYALAEPLLPKGRLLDLGCGVGHSYHLLAGRETVGVDIDASALEGQARETHVADMRSLHFADGEFSSVLSVQSLEHVPDPWRVVAEAARVVAADGVVIFVTPNRLTLGRPDEIIDPYHHVEFDAHELEVLCARGFGSVEVLGLFGSERYMELFDEERRKLDRLLALRSAAPAQDGARGGRNSPLRLAAAAQPCRGRPSGRGHRRRRFRAAVDRSRGRTRPHGRMQIAQVSATAEACAWCGAPLEGASGCRPRLARCERCGALTRTRRPSGKELDRAYGDWYRPKGERRFSFLGDAILGRSRALLADAWTRSLRPARCWTSAPAKARCWTRYGRAAGRRSAWSARDTAPTCATNRSRTSKGKVPGRL